VCDAAVAVSVLLSVGVLMFVRPSDPRRRRGRIRRRRGLV